MLSAFWNTTVEALLPIYSVILSIAVPAAVAYALKLFRDKTGMDIEAHHRDALQTAITNAALAVLKRTGGTATAGQVAEAVRNVGTEYVIRAVPDAVSFFERQGLSSQGIADRVQAKVAAAIAPGEAVEGLSGREAMDAALAQILRQVKP